jgi:hypothetical protein
MGDHTSNRRDEDARALPDLFLKNSISISQVDEGVPLVKDSENRLARTRKRQLSVSKSIIHRIIRVLTSENRKPDFHLLHVLSPVSPALGHKR